MIPVFIYHEGGQKKTFASGMRQSYVKYCVRSAEDYNETVILLGDSHNIKYCKQGVLAEDYINDKWKSFEKVFVNLTVDYPDAWAKGFFKRFFLVEEYLKRNHMQDCVILDSDVLSYVDYTQYFLGMDIDVAYNLLHSDFSATYDSASAHVSYFTYSALKTFTDYCIEQYTEKNKILWDFYDETVRNHWAGGVTEMGLLYLFVKEHREIRGYNLLEERNHSVFDNTFYSNFRNYSMGYNGIQYKADSFYSVKITQYVEGKPFFIKKNDEMVQALALHCGQISKMYMRDYYLYGHLGIVGRIRYMAEDMRKKASFVKHNVLKIK